MVLALLCAMEEKMAEWVIFSPLKIVVLPGFRVKIRFHPKQEDLEEEENILSSVQNLIEENYLEIMTNLPVSEEVEEAFLIKTSLLREARKKDVLGVMMSLQHVLSVANNFVILMSLPTAEKPSV